jgi:hypothetical protein
MKNRQCHGEKRISLKGKQEEQTMPWRIENKFEGVTRRTDNAMANRE